ncbi:AAA family ATPase [Aurantibacillus circumpalustris]|uniref:AAA family ATPase n=1 Tax=Aurantibacillus circumpalustris TaxID=3036359 RepID=UPI00295A787A|nr:AAA family ATPase [Aurantibacillus circumpalustris]
MIKAINISEDVFSSYNYNPEKELDNLSKVNIFIGPNNSGKSRFLRHLFALENLKFTSDNYDLKTISLKLKLFKEKILMEVENNGALPDAFSKKYLDNLEIPELSNFEIKVNLDKLITFLNDILKIKQENFQLSFRVHAPNTNYLLKFFIEKTGELLLDIEKIIGTNEGEFYERAYIPILRGLRPIQLDQTGKNLYKAEGTDNYLIRTVEDYFSDKTVNGKVNINVYSGLNIYSDIKSQLLNSREQRENIKQFENFLQKNFFENRTVTLIPQKGKDVLLVGIGETEKLIHELGDGIQALILLLYPIFINRGRKFMFFIEEPELFMHPGMQRVFLETLLSDEFKDMQFFLTTHSHHFLDLTFDNKNISIYSFAFKDDKFKIKNLLSPAHFILSELGIRNSSLFLSNCTIWVEGVTDRKYIRKFLEMYSNNNSNYKRFLEDLHYSFIEYAGSNITHWNFEEESDDEKIGALKINHNIFLIVDSDVLSNGQKPTVKELRHENLKKALGDKLYITEGKEIENMLSFDTIKNVVAYYEKKNTRDLKFKKGFVGKSKVISQNSGLEIEKPIYWNKNIGELIDKTLDGRTRDYKDGNTIMGKDTFCHKAIESIKKYEDLSEEAKDLSRRIFEFIANCNK